MYVVDHYHVQEVGKQWALLLFFGSNRMYSIGLNSESRAHKIGQAAIKINGEHLADLLEESDEWEFIDI